MSQEDAYFQFPLRYITDAAPLRIRDFHDRRRIVKDYGDGVAVRLIAARDHASWLVYHSTKLPHLQFQADEYRKKNHAKVHHSGPLSESLKSVLGVANLLNYVWESIDDKSAQNNLAIWQMHENERLAKGWQVRLRTDIYWDIFNNPEHWPIAKLRTLAAIYAIIATHGIVRVSYLKIRALASGARGVEDAKQRNVKLMPERTVRDWIDKLYDRGLFRVCLHNGHRYYALSGVYDSDEQFAAAVVRFNQPRKRRKVLDTAELTAAPAGTQGRTMNAPPPHPNAHPDTAPPAAP